MTDREKLIELLDGFSTPVTLNGEKLMDWNIPMPGLRKAIADHLLANGVRLETKQATSDENKRWIPVTENRNKEDNGQIQRFNRNAIRKIGCSRASRKR